MASSCFPNVVRRMDGLNKGRILFFNSVTQIGGAETNMISIGEELAKRGFEIHFATLENNGPMFGKCQSYATSTHEIGRYEKHPFHSVARYKRILKEYRFDYVLNFG